MSHFSVLIIGEKGVDKALYPFWELDLNSEEIKKDPRSVFEDETEIYLKQYNEDACSEFYCDSNISWGYEVEKSVFDQIKTAPYGRLLDIELYSKPLSYLSKDKRYRCYYKTKTGKRCKGRDVWFRVKEILQTDHPNKDVCMRGICQLEAIEPPKKIFFKDRYSTFEEYVKDWDGGIEENGKFGYYHNPNSKWDWYLIGGRFAGSFILKPGKTGIQGRDRKKEFAEITGKKVDDLPPNKVDQALKGDIDFDRTNNNPKLIKELEKEWNETVVQKKGFYKPEYFLKKYGTKKNYIKVEQQFSTWAILTEDGKWIEQGNMGWFGQSDAKPSKQVEFKNNFYKLFIEDLPDDTLLTVVDCHI